MKVELYRDKSGKWRYRAIASNGQNIGASEAYYSKSNAKRAAKKLYPTARIKTA